MPVRTRIDTQESILCDALEIEQVLLNLINNGIDAARTQDEKWVEIRVFEEGESVIAQVLDSGTGVSREIEAKIFQPFFTTKKTGEGTGLGLSISKGILDQHSATIALNRSLPNTCFEVRFSRCHGSTGSDEPRGLKNAA